MQNTRKGERLQFSTLEPYAGKWLHAAGEYADRDGTMRQVAVSIGPKYGTVDSDWVREAAKEALRGVGFDILVVCGFAFDPYVYEAAKKYRKPIVLPIRMNTDLSMEGGLLKNTGAGNLFMSLESQTSNSITYPMAGCF